MVVCVRKLPSNAIKTEVKDLFSKYGEISEFEFKDDQAYVVNCHSLPVADLQCIAH